MVENGKDTSFSPVASPAEQELSAQPAVDIKDYVNVWPVSVNGEEKTAGSDGNEAQQRIDAAIVEAAVTPEFEIVEELEREGIEAVEVIGEQGLQAAQRATVCYADNLRKLTVQTASFSRDSLDNGSAFLGELLRANSMPSVFHLQLEYVRSAYARLLKHLAEVNGLYWNFVQESSKLSGKPAAKAEV
jgi:hypothetical protein